MNEQNVHAENKRLYCEDWTKTDKPWELWEKRALGTWLLLTDHPLWEPESMYRRIDPYRKLKEAAQDPTKQIRLIGYEWKDASDRWLWVEPPENYEVRDKPAEKKLVKYLCYETPINALVWSRENVVVTNCSRVPEFDKEVLR